MKKIRFKVGEKVVHASDGVGEITGVIKRRIAETDAEMFDITILSTGMKILVPVSQADTGQLRRVIDRRSVEKVYTILRSRDFVVDRQTWNRRYREYCQKINTGSLYEIAEVMRDLAVLSKDKELSHGEKQMLDRAEGRLASEIAVAKGRAHELVVGEIRAFFPHMSVAIRSSAAA